VSPGGRTALFRAAKIVVEIFELVMVFDGIHAGGNGDDGFPAIVHQMGAAHLVTFLAHDGVGFDTIPAQGLLLGVELHFDRIKIAVVPQLALRGKIGADGSAPGEQEQGGQNEQ